MLAVITQVFNAEFVISTGIPFNKINAEIETQPVTIEGKISKCSR